MDEVAKTNKLRQRMRTQRRPPKPGGVAIPCYEFFPLILGVVLTPGQRVIVKVTVDNVPYSQLDEEEQSLYRILFGLSGEEIIPEEVRVLVMLLLGRASGKSLICSGIAIYLALTLSCEGTGPGQIPVFMCVAPTKPDALNITLSSVKALTIDNPKLSAFVADKADDYVELLRPDGQRVRIQAVAADKGGRNTRGRDIIGFLLDEAQFFNSDPSGRYMVNDRDVYQAMMPRLLEGARGFFISTPWPTENFMATEVKENFGKPTTSLVAIAPTEIMRPNSPKLLERIKKERLRDPDNAKREFDCDTTAIRIGTFFDPAAARAAISESIDFLDPVRYPTVCAVDFAVTKDCAAIAVVQFDGQNYNDVYMDELAPTEGKPLVPGEVVKHWAEVAKTHGCTFVIADSFYRESIKEHLAEEQLGLVPVPEGITGKNKSYLRAKAMLDDGRAKLRDNPRFIAQLTAITAKPTVGGLLSIKAPRRIGQGHSDMVSAWVAAVHFLSYSEVVINMQRPKPGQEGYLEWLKSKRAAKEAEEEDRYVEECEREILEEMREAFYGKRKDLEDI